MQGWQTVADIATAAGVVAAIGFGLWSGLLTRNGQRRDQEVSLAAAHRSEAAAALTEDYTRRVVDALEAIARGSQTPTQSSPSAQVRWQLTHPHGHTYVLTNIGTTTAHDVNVGSHESLVLVNVPDPHDVRPDEAIEFMAARSLATSDSTITVTWASDGRQQDWKYPLPS